jgi:asparagine synthase (glutamine-hydrolysing)
MCGIWGILSLDNIDSTNVPKYFEGFNKIKSRGPDRSIFITNPNYIIGFHRLAIMDTSIQGDQPFSLTTTYTNVNGEKFLRTTYVIVNGEIYNWEKLRSDSDIQKFCNEIGYKYKSGSDCEVILPMFLKYVSNNSYKHKDLDTTTSTTSTTTSTEPIYENKGLTELLNRLDGEFAFAIFDTHINLETNKEYFNLWIGRDRFGIRPLFFSYLNDNTICFGSEMKSIIGLNRTQTHININDTGLEEISKVEQIDPRSWYYWGGIYGCDKLIFKNKLYYSVGAFPLVRNPYPEDVYRICRELLTKSVVDRLHSDREVGCLLSGGLDSSLIASIASNELKKQGRTLKTFSIGMPNSPDVKYAKIVANHIGSIHTNFEIPQEEWIDAIEKVIEISETFDITTIRATTGQYLISKKIAETTNIKVLLIGDGSDEATGGYIYFHKAPTPMDLHFETKRLLHWIHYYDVLRADRGVATNGLEARVPFLYHEFIDFYFKIDPVLRMPKPHTLSTGETNIYEKYLLRKSFEKTNLLPECVLWRKKEAFSDGVSSETKSWYQIVQEKVELMFSDEQFEILKKKYQFYNELTNSNVVVPHTKEALWFHLIFDKYYPEQYHIIPYYWMPKWIDNVNDPSARTLKLYKEIHNNNQTNTNLKPNNYNLVSIPKY